MPSADTNLFFLGAALLLALTPGPDNLFVLMQSASAGRKAGILVVLGLCTGLLVHTTAVTLGLAALFAASAAAFTVLKFAGAGYLAYLAWQAFRAPAGMQAEGDRAAASAGQLYLRGIVMNLTNPKVVLFFLAFLPQFVRPEAGRVGVQLAWFGLLFIVATMLAFSALAFLAGYFGEKLRRSERAQRCLNRAAAFVFGGLALKLVTSTR
ncbi:MAG: LysE family translocator [Gemmatimonadota bacterium]